jgi:hypothetical protein
MNKGEAMTRSTVVLAAVGALALSPAPAAAESHDRTITLKAVGRVDQVKLVDNAPTGDSPGDLLVFTEKLFNTRGKRIGSDAATCVRLFDPTSLCTGTYKLPGGSLMVQLVQPGPTGTYDQAVTGGTGRFAGARGTVRDAQNPKGDRFTFKTRVDRR